MRISFAGLEIEQSIWPTEAATARSLRLILSIARAPRHCCGVRLEVRNGHHFLWRSSVVIAEISNDDQYCAAVATVLAPAMATVPDPR